MCVRVGRCVAASEVGGRRSEGNVTAVAVAVTWRPIADLRRRLGRGSGLTLVACSWLTDRVVGVNFPHARLKCGVVCADLLDAGLDPQETSGHRLDLLAFMPAGIRDRL